MDRDRYLQVAAAAAKEAGRIQKEFTGKVTRVEYKGEINPVTEVDKLCEEVIVRRIREAFPAHDILTEESPFQGRGGRWKWIIDPLDGTTNYLRGLSCFSVSIALEVEGKVTLGVVYDPSLDELFHGELGRGAFLNGNRISVSATPILDRSFLCTGFPYDLRQHLDFYLRYFREFMLRSLAIRRLGSAALDLCYLAAGRFDGFWEFKLHAWDVAAASLIVTEAGGTVTDLRGRPFDIYGQEILASNGVLHDEMLRVIREVERSSKAEAKDGEETV